MMPLPNLHSASVAIGTNPVFIQKIVSTVIALVLLWALRYLVNKIVTKRAPNTKIEYRCHKAIGYITVGIGIFLLARIWVEGFESISTIIGLASAGIAIALKDPIINIAGWGYILWEDPFSVGDRIEIGEFKGDVVDQQLMQFTIMEIGNWIHGDQNTGRMIHVPNGMIFHAPLSNYSDDFAYLWDEKEVRLTFESNWKRAKEIIQEILEEYTKEVSKEAEKALRKASHKFMIMQDNRKFVPHVYTQVTEYGVMLDAHYIVEYSKRRKASHEIWEKILTEFNKCDDIMFAYPTWRIHNKADMQPFVAQEPEELAENES